MRLMPGEDGGEVEEPLLRVRQGEAEDEPEAEDEVQDSDCEEDWKLMSDAQEYDNVRDRVLRTPLARVPWPSRPGVCRASKHDHATKVGQLLQTGSVAVIEILQLEA